MLLSTIAGYFCGVLYTLCWEDYRLFFIWSKSPIILFSMISLFSVAEEMSLNDHTYRKRVSLIEQYLKVCAMALYLLYS